MDDGQDVHGAGSHAVGYDIGSAGDDEFARSLDSADPTERRQKIKLRDSRVDGGDDAERCCWVPLVKIGEDCIDIL